jgi:hypothetical protein
VVHTNSSTIKSPTALRIPAVSIPADKPAATELQPVLPLTPRELHSAQGLPQTVSSDFAARRAGVFRFQHGALRSQT